MNRFTTISFEALIKVIRQQFDEEVDFIGFKGAGCDLVDGKSTLGFFDIVFHAAALVVKPPYVPIASQSRFVTMASYCQSVSSRKHAWSS